MNAPSPKLIADCPNPECGFTVEILDATNGVSDFYKAQCTVICGYEGPCAETKAEAIRLHNLICRPNPETQAVTPNAQEVKHNDELMGKIFNITRSADSLDSSWLGKVRAAINEYIKENTK